MGATIQNFEIVSIALPVGLTWERNNAANGCITIRKQTYMGVYMFLEPHCCRQYDVDVSILCDVTALDIDNVPVEFSMSFNITNPAIGNSGFTSTPIMGLLRLLSISPTIIQDYYNTNGILVMDKLVTLKIHLLNLFSTRKYPVQYSAYSNLDTIDLYNLSEVTIHNISGWGPEYIPFYIQITSQTLFYRRENGNLIYQSNFIHNDNGPNTWQVNINLHRQQLHN